VSQVVLRADQLVFRRSRFQGRGARSAGPSQIPILFKYLARAPYPPYADPRFVSGLIARLGREHAEGVLNLPFFRYNRPDQRP
jgi:hypothetical protein